MADFLKDRSIKYLNKDFESLKRDLMKFSQAHHSGVFQDYNEASPGMALLELTAFVGDVLSFHQDMQFLELQGETARQLENVVAFAKSKGYRPVGKRAASTNQTFLLEIPATTINGNVVPNPVYCPILRKGAQVQGPNGVLFETQDDIYFSASAPTPNTDRILEVTGSRFNQTTGQPTYFALRKDSVVVAGETKVDTITIPEFQAFRQIELTNPDVLEILSVVDSDGNNWYEVDYLAQETIFESVENGTDDNDVVPYTLTFKTVPRRFTTDMDPTTSKTSLIFGSGDGISYDDELIPNIADMALPLPGRSNFPGFSIDPQNFLKTRTLGLSPFNTTLTVTYRVGGGSQTNVPALSIRGVGNATLDFTSTQLDSVQKGEVLNSLETVNFVKTEGGASEETMPEIVANAGAFFAAQNRVVTKEDYMSRILSLPAKFGKPAKVRVRKNTSGESALNIHVLALDSDGHLTQATPTLVQNIITYLSRYRMLTDGVNLLQSDIINLKLDFGVVVNSKMNRTEVLAKCLDAAKTYLATSQFQIGQPIVLSDLSSVLQNIVGVISVYKLGFKNAFGLQSSGLQYSPVRFDPSAWTFNGILYCPEDSIFEVKFPNVDIVGESK